MSSSRLPACGAFAKRVCTAGALLLTSTAALVAAVATALVVAAAGEVGAQTAGPVGVPPAEHQIAEAVQAAPPMDRAGAQVLGFADDGSWTTLREGSNTLVCLADDPSREGWNVACYHESLDPFMARGRELRAQGVTNSSELAQRRWDEADAGTLSMPESPATLYVLTGDGYDAEADEVANPFLRWVIYTPWATPEETGLSPQPTGPGAPWLMFPGTAGAHIMITPPMPGAGS